MKKFLNIIWINMKLILHQPSKLLFLLIMPIMIVFFINMTSGGGSKSDTIVHFENTGSPLSDIIKKSGIAEVVVNDRERVEKNLYLGKNVIAYFIPDKYEDKLLSGNPPKIEVKTTSEGYADVRFEKYLQQYNQNMAMNNQLSKMGIKTVDSILPEGGELIKITDDSGVISSDYFMSVLILLMFIMMNSTYLVKDLIEMKKNNVLTRVIATPNRDFFQISSLMIGNLLISIVFNIIALVVMSLIMGFTITNYFVIIAVIATMSFVSTSLSLALFRLVKNELLVSMIPVIIAVGSAFMVMFYELKRFEIAIAEVVGKLSPYYWAIETLDKNKLLPGIPIMLLMGMVFLTAGSFRLREYAFK